MSEADLQSWLLEDGIGRDLDTIVRCMVRAELDNLVADVDAVSSDRVDWPRLLFAGSILARSEIRAHQEAALRIATGAVTLSDRVAIKDAGAVLLDKLSNTRAVALASLRNLVSDGLDGRLGTMLRAESQRRQMEQSILVETSGRWLRVNDFQQRFWSLADDHNWLSASAPTASGKTFLVLQWLVDRMLAENLRVTVYLAPTRALVSEIEGSLVRVLDGDKRVDISSLPLREKYDLALKGGQKLVLVLTQERLHLLANTLGDKIILDMLIVDEAHKIGDNNRGIVLQDAIERVSRANPGLTVVFISPATQNPEVLLADAPEGTKKATIESDAPTVLQNLIVAEQVPHKPRQWLLSVRERDTNVPIGTLAIASLPNTTRKRLAFVAAAAGQRGGTLVYANGAADAEQIAILISQLVLPESLPDQELMDLADLARKGIHPKYMLAPLAEKGVAFHYGNMPSLIRLEVERLFRSGKIRFLVCTSTLIEGVNLSCRTIVLRGPRKGMGHPMAPHDFWNLAGRAGRWGDEFQGNIICVDPKNSQAWPNGIPARARYPIKRESDAVLDVGDGMADYLDRRATTALTELRDVERFEQVGSYLLATYLRLGSITQAALAKRHSTEMLGMLDQRLSVLAKKVEISAAMAGRHPGVSALGLQNLLEAFRVYPGNVENLLPVTVNTDVSYDRFKTIMARINMHLFPAFVPDGLIPLHALVVVQWLKGFSLATMIRRNIAYHDVVRRTYNLPVLIRRTMELVEQIARFRAPKYLSAYVDVLNLYLTEIGRADLINHDLDIGTQLEFGVSSPTLLALMELGLSRMSAVVLYERIARDDMDKESCLAWVSERETQFEGMDIPTIIVREIREKLLRRSGDGLKLEK
jgi:superfamily II DNA/RNA helicase